MTRFQIVLTSIPTHCLLRVAVVVVKTLAIAYNPRHPERNVLYRMVAEHCETGLEQSSAEQFDGQGDHQTPPAYVEKAFHKYLDSDIFAHGFARVRCDDCGADISARGIAKPADLLPRRGKG